MHRRVQKRKEKKSQAVDHALNCLCKVEGFEHFLTQALDALRDCKDTTNLIDWDTVPTGWLFVLVK
jgi:hypothetical protein